MSIYAQASRSPPAPPSGLFQPLVDVDGDADVNVNGDVDVDANGLGLFWRSPIVPLRWRIASYAKASRFLIYCPPPQS